MTTKKNIKIIDEIQKVRSKNNKCWMDILRVAINFAPKQTKKLLSQINSNDRKISNLLYKINGKK